MLLVELLRARWGDAPSKGGGITDEQAWEYGYYFIIACIVLGVVVILVSQTNLFKDLP